MQKGERGGIAGIWGTERVSAEESQKNERWKQSCFSDGEGGHIW